MSSGLFLPRSRFTRRQQLRLLYMLVLSLCGEGWVDSGESTCPLPAAAAAPAALFAVLSFGLGVRADREGRMTTCHFSPPPDDLMRPGGRGVCLASPLRTANLMGMFRKGSKGAMLHFDWSETASLRILRVSECDHDCAAVSSGGVSRPSAAAVLNAGLIGKAMSRHHDGLRPLWLGRVTHNR